MNKQTITLSSYVIANYYEEGIIFLDINFPQKMRAGSTGAAHTSPPLLQLMGMTERIQYASDLQKLIGSKINQPRPLLEGVKLLPRAPLVSVPAMHASLLQIIP